MKRSQKMRPAWDLAARQERKAAQDLGRLLQRAGQERRRLEELEAWEREYAARLQQGVASLNDLLAQRQFLHELGRAIEAQSALVQEAEQAAAHARAAWQDRHARHAAVSRVIERFEALERRSAERREQQALDEYHATRLLHKGPP